MQNIISIIYIIITLLFVSNFLKIASQIRGGSKKVNEYSLLATSSLVLHFLTLAIYFGGHNYYIILGSQAYMLLCMLIIKFLKKKKG